MKARKKDKFFLQFISYFSKLEVTEAIGVAKLLGVQLLDSDGNSREPDDISNDILVTFNKMKDDRKEVILSIMRAAAYVRTKDTKKE